MVIKNFDVEILGEDDKPEVLDGKPVLALEIVKRALSAMYQDEPNLDGEEKFQRYELRQRLKDGGDQELSPEEIVLLKKLIGKGFNVNAVGQLYKILNA